MLRHIFAVYFLKKALSCSRKKSISPQPPKKNFGFGTSWKLCHVILCCVMLYQIACYHNIIILKLSVIRSLIFVFFVIMTLIKCLKGNPLVISLITQAKFNYTSTNRCPRHMICAKSFPKLSIAVECYNPTNTLN